jgi:uncharacterized membrane protein
MSNPKDYEPYVAPVEKNFFQALFDLKFTEWVTLRVAGVLYLITVILVSLVALIGLVSFVATGPSFAFVLLAMVLAAIVWFLVVLLVRLGIEASIATIAVAQNTASLKK